jgi:hypothetical protein
MRSRLIVFLAVVLASAIIAPAFADPVGDLSQARKAFAALKSVHADMKLPDGRAASMDMIEPHKVHATFSGMQFISIGQDVWINMGGRWVKAPRSAGRSAQTMVETAQNPGLETNVRGNCTVTDAGPAPVGRIATRKYHMICKDTSDRAIDVWVGMNHLPVQIQILRGKGLTTITYSKYNSVADITPPM